MCLGVPGQLVERLPGEGDAAVGLVQFGGLARRVWLACVPDAVAGDYLVVHAGIAISKVDAEEAARMLNQLETLAEMGEWTLAADGADS